jgi:hypothetical protein
MAKELRLTWRIAVIDLRRDVCFFFCVIFACWSFVYFCKAASSNIDGEGGGDGAPTASPFPCCESRVIAIPNTMQPMPTPNVSRSPHKRVLFS